MSDSIYGVGLETRYIPATNYKPSRISVKHTDDPDRRSKRVIVSYDDCNVDPRSASQSRDPHERAIRTWLEKNADYYAASGGIFSGCPFTVFATGTKLGYVFTLVPEYAMPKGGLEWSTVTP